MRAETCSKVQNLCEGKLWISWYKQHFRQTPSWRFSIKFKLNSRWTQNFTELQPVQKKIKKKILLKTISRLNKIYHIKLSVEFFSLKFWFNFWQYRTFLFYSISILKFLANKMWYGAKGTNIIEMTHRHFYMISYLCLIFFVEQNVLSLFPVYPVK